MTGWICLAAYAGDPELLAEQVSSIRAQTVTSFRCVIGIDGKDAALRGQAEYLTADDPRFAIIEFPDQVGFYRNFERLLTRVPTDAQWVALSDQDDRWAPNKLARLLPGLAAGPSAVVGQARVVDRNGAVLAERTSRRKGDVLALLLDNQVTGSLAVFRREVLDLALPFPDSTDIAYHDHWLGVCAALQGGIRSIDEIVQDYVQHSANAVGEELDQRLGRRIAALRTKAGTGRARDMARYLRDHRWGWRVAMARTLERRVTTSDASQRRQVALVAQGHGSLRLLGAATARVARRQAPFGRTLGLMVGAACWPRTKEGDG